MNRIERDQTSRPTKPRCASSRKGTVGNSLVPIVLSVHSPCAVRAPETTRMSRKAETMPRKAEGKPARRLLRCRPPGMLCEPEFALCVAFTPTLFNLGPRVFLPTVLI
jgi:hypothetical protein